MSGQPFLSPSAPIPMVASFPLLLLAISMAGQAAPVPSPTPTSAPPPEQALRFESHTVSFGEVYQFSDIDVSFTAVNRGTRPVHIKGLFAATTGGTVVADPPDVVPPGGRLQVRAHQPVGNRLGSTAFRFRVDTDDPGGPSMKLSSSGFVQSAYDPEQVRLEFGTVERARGAQAEAEVTTREADRLDVAGIEGVPAWFALEPTVDRSSSPPSIKLRASVRPGAPLGPFVGVALLRTSVASQPALEITFRGAVDGDIVPSDHAFDFQAVESGQRVERVVRLRRRAGGEAPRVLRVEGLTPQTTYAARPCESDPSCTAVAVSLTAGEPGFVKGSLDVFVEGEADPLPFALGALVVAPGTAIRSLPVSEAEQQQQQAEPALARMPSFGSSSTAPASPPPPSQVREVRLRWTAAAEERLYGYIAYRAEERQGPYRRVSRDIVKVQAGDGAHRYEFVDRDVQAGRTYYYYLDVVTVGGRKVTFSGVLARSIAADAKAP